MSGLTVVKETENFVKVTTDTSKLALFNNETDSADYTNGTGAEIDIPAGTVLGVINASGKVALLTSAAVDGSQFPVGVLAQDHTVANGATVSLTYIISGDVDVSKIVLQGSDTLNTVVSGRRIRERIAADTKGIRLVASTELTKTI
jgi:hypothetical protein